MAGTRAFAGHRRRRAWKPPFAPPSSAPLCAADGRNEALREGKRPGEPAYSGSLQVLAELDSDVPIPVRSHHPRRSDVVVRPEDVRQVFGAGHEHGVELSIVDARRPVADVLTRLVAKAAVEVEVRA